MKAFPVITLENKKHRGNNQILMHFGYDKDLIAIARDNHDLYACCAQRSVGDTESVGFYHNTNK